MTAVMNTIKNIAGALILLFITSTSSSATATCSRNVRECLMTEARNSRASCFAIAAKTPACSDSLLGGILGLRANVTTLGSEQRIIPVTELGEAKATNYECLRNFDSLLASTLIYAEPSESELRQLATTLRFCLDGSPRTSR